jgi:hypothetical protein
VKKNKKIVDLPKGRPRFFLGFPESVAALHLLVALPDTVRVCT